ncbi:replication factor C subunit 1 [Pneumocystis jirovecii RU7]|uniref:Replication factor C subunit 1 n=1 Tax=Pneumocystis jirovecii (strain RU7) TaxID=1408657 RepID=A0A0W4ZVQ2_PNEJ7|nr:replication factor C subunit 1 [Pneumocystis jirovecii RU7]KTW32453.1 hypothetical protein T551_00543 [Pneumocystis jirovecii RU7]
MSDIRNWLLEGELVKKSAPKTTKNRRKNEQDSDKKTKKRVVLSDNEEITIENKKKSLSVLIRVQSTEDSDLVPTNAYQFFADKNKISRSSSEKKKTTVKEDVIQEDYMDDDSSFSQSDLLEFEKLGNICKNEENEAYHVEKHSSKDIKNNICDTSSKPKKNRSPKKLKETIDTSSPVKTNSLSNKKNKDSMSIAKETENIKYKKNSKEEPDHLDSNTTNKKKTNIENTKDVAQKVLDECPLISLSDIKVSDAKEIKFYNKTVSGPSKLDVCKEIPIGRENCLSGLTFVFTGIMKSIDREEGHNLIKKYGGKVTNAPSSKTSFVVLGEDAGPKKIEVIKKNNLKTIDENGLFYLIKNMPTSGGNTKAAQAAQKKREEEDQEAREMAKSMAPKTSEMQKSQSCQLWTTKYAPRTLKEICGNKSLVEKLQKWLHDWDKNRIANFKKSESDGLGFYRAVLISGPPGIGKTTSAHLVASLEGYDVLEFNASDTRSRKLLEESLNKVYNNTSLNGFFLLDEQTAEKKKNKFVIIMDEVDGVSSGDQGGIGELNSFIKKTQIPIICICNDRASRKLLPLDRTTFDLKFRRPDVNSLRSRIMSIAYREGLKLEPQAIDQLAESTHGDIRQIINILSSWKLSQNSMNIDDGKNAAKAAEKHIIMKPWDIVGKFLSGGIFKHTSKVTLSDKIELYFNDHELSHLMLQENYLKTQPDTLNSIVNLKQKNHEHLKLIENASEAISRSDLIDFMIHGPQQHWSLMPMHAVFSCVIPAFYVSGFGTSQYSFTSVLGNISKANKLIKYLQSIQTHMSLKTTGNCNEIRQFYVPLLFDLLLRRLQNKGQDAIPNIIRLMDEYFLSKEHSEYILELGIGPNNGNLLKIPSQTKASFTKQYNKANHPIAFCSTIATNKSNIKHNIPDLEDILETNPEEPEELDSENDDPGKDKFIIENAKRNKKIQNTAKKGKKNSTK